MKRRLLVFSAAVLFLVTIATAQVRIEYDANNGLEPDDPNLGLGFWSVRYGKASFPNEDKGPFVTEDDDTTDFRGGGGRYYRRQFTTDEFNDETDLRVEA